MLISGKQNQVNKETNMKLKQAVSLNLKKWKRVVTESKAKICMKKKLHISTKCNNILVLIGEDWSLSRLEYQVTYASQT
jgi:hypothetical protein